MKALAESRRAVRTPLWNQGPAGSWPTQPAAPYEEVPKSPTVGGSQPPFERGPQRFNMLRVFAKNVLYLLRVVHCAAAIMRVRQGGPINGRIRAPVVVDDAAPGLHVHEQGRPQRCITTRVIKASIQHDQHRIPTSHRARAFSGAPNPMLHASSATIRIRPGVGRGTGFHSVEQAFVKVFWYKHPPISF